MELKVDLPDTLADEAKAAGLLTSQAIERLLREAVRSQAVNELFETADRLAAANIAPMTMAEIQAEVDAVRKARRGDGPTFLEFRTYRWREHCGPSYDNQLGYRLEAEFESWKTRCPVTSLASQMLQQDIVTQQELDEIARRVSSEIEGAFAFAKASSFPEPRQLHDHIYAS